MNVEVGFYGVGILLLLLLLRVPVVLAMIAVSFGGIASLLGIRPALGIVTPSGSTVPGDAVRSTR